jgi:ribosome assembly protein YihI (activator of Der GTPase)
LSIERFALWLSLACEEKRKRKRRKRRKGMTSGDVITSGEGWWYQRQEG